MDPNRALEKTVIAGQMVISVLLRNPSKITECDLNPMMFWNHTDSLIFGTMLEMESAKMPIDVITVTEKLINKTGKSYLDVLAGYCTKGGGSDSNIKAYCEIIKNNYRKTRAREIATTLINDIENDLSVESAISDLMSLTSEDKNYEYDLSSACKIGLQEIEERFNNKGVLVGVNTGLTKLNEAIGGFHESDLIIIGARPAMGKTALLLNMVIKAGEKVGLISAEQGVNQIIQRMMAITGGVSVTNLRSGNLTDDDWTFLEAGCSKIKAHPGCHFYDKSSPTIQEVESLARRWVYEFGIKALYIDYLQRLQVPSGARKSDIVAENTRRLKDLARELNIPIIVLAQVKRDVETRSDRRPNMGDISDSSESEKEADVILMMYRDEYYNPDSDFKGVIELNAEKNRHGPTGTMCTKWTPSIMRISDLQEPTNEYH